MGDTTGTVTTAELAKERHFKAGTDTLENQRKKEITSMISFTTTGNLRIKESKICEWCNKEFFRKNQTDKNWAKIRFCSKGCATRGNYERIVLKNCANCGSVIKPREGQSPSSYKRQKFCSSSCSVKSTKSGFCFRDGPKHHNWSGGFSKNSNYTTILVGSGIYRPIHIILVEWYLGRRLEKDECVHHCNGNTKDNRLENLELMTRVEHSRVHCHQLHGTEAKRKAVMSRAGRFKKEKHSCWKQQVTEERVINALRSGKTQKEAASDLGICADTLRARVKHMRNKGVEIC